MVAMINRGQSMPHISACSRRENRVTMLTSVHHNPWLISGHVSYMFTPYPPSDLKTLNAVSNDPVATKLSVAILHCSVCDFNDNMLVFIFTQSWGVSCSEHAGSGASGGPCHITTMLDYRITDWGTLAACHIILETVTPFPVDLCRQTWQ